jgi:4-hydroxy-tetrahydrodipicolinate synthase
MEVRGVIGVTVTPFTKDWRVDLDAVRAQAERLAQSEIAGLFPCASTGEFPHLTAEEQKSVYVATKEGVGGRKALVAGACAPNLRRAAACAETAKELGYDACVACPPYYYPLLQEEVYAFYRELAKESPLPVILYHVPFFTTGIAEETVRRLARIPRIIGIKDSSANMKRIGHLCELHGERKDFRIFTGTDDCLFPALAAGVDGSMTAFAAGAPELVTDVYRAFGRGDLAEAGRCQRRMMPLLETADALPFPLGYKLVAQAYHHLPMTERYHQQAGETVVQAALEKIEIQLKMALQN